MAVLLPIRGGSSNRSVNIAPKESRSMPREIAPRCGIPTDELITRGGFPASVARSLTARRQQYVTLRRIRLAPESD
jgi:hypothetical protein